MVVSAHYSGISGTSLTGTFAKCFMNQHVTHFRPERQNRGNVAVDVQVGGSDGLESAFV